MGNFFLESKEQIKERQQLKDLNLVLYINTNKSQISDNMYQKYNKSHNYCKLTDGQFTINIYPNTIYNTCLALGRYSNDKLCDMIIIDMHFECCDYHFETAISDAHETKLFVDNFKDVLDSYLCDDLIDIIIHYEFDSRKYYPKYHPLLYPRLV